MACFVCARRVSEPLEPVLCWLCKFFVGHSVPVWCSIQCRLPTSARSIPPTSNLLRRLPVSVLHLLHNLIGILSVGSYKASLMTALGSLMSYSACLQPTRCPRHRHLEALWRSPVASPPALPTTPRQGRTAHTSLSRLRLRRPATLKLTAQSSIRSCTWETPATQLLMARQVLILFGPHACIVANAAERMLP